MELLEMFYDLTGSEKSKMAASKTGKSAISACRHDRNEIQTAITMFSRCSNPMGLSVLLRDLTGSMKTKMASFKPEVPASQLVKDIVTKFQWLYRVFGVGQHGETSGNTVRCLGM